MKKSCWASMSCWKGCWRMSRQRQMDAKKPRLEAAGLDDDVWDADEFCEPLDGFYPWRRCHWQ